MTVRSRISRRRARARALPRASLCALLLAAAAAPNSTESAIANGDTRTLSFTNQHTNESGTFTYKLNGYYDPAQLEKLNWFMRDWRLNESTKMDPKLFDILWEVYRQSSSSQPIDVLSGYRSPSTNAMLRRRSRLVAEHSQHMEGRAIDAHFIDVSTATIRDVAMRLQAGGVGFYPVGSTPWVHVDSGSVRYWPRMSRDALTRLFPDGKTVFIPADGQPMPGYEQARAEIEARGGEVLTASNTSPNIFAWLFGARGGGADDAEEAGPQSVVTAGRNVRAGNVGVVVASAAPDTITAARGNLPRGQTYLQPAVAAAQAPAAPAADTPAQQPATVVAAAEEPKSDEPSPVTLHGPIAAQFIAPLPPRKPTDLVETVAVVAPLPPPRPQEYALAAQPQQSAPPAASASSKPDGANGDLIAALLERGKLPGEITRGVKLAPSSALALADTRAAPEPPARPSALARAAELALPPLPPPRPRPAPKTASANEITIAPKSPATPIERPRPPAGHASNANPFGDLVVDAFNAPAPDTSPALVDGLRGSAQ